MMIKKEFTIACANDGSVSLNEAPYFNKMESGVTKLSFTLPEIEGYAYLMCRHDLKEWYAIPIIDGVIMIGQTVTSKHGRWAFNVCVTEKELINVEQADGVIYMSDVFEGLVYDNIVDKNPAAMEPNVLKLGNDFRFLYEELKSKQDVIEQDLIRAEGAVVGLEAALNTAKGYMDAAKASADASEASSVESGGFANEAEQFANDAKESAKESEKWARDSFISSEVCREKSVHVENLENMAREEAYDSRNYALMSKRYAEESAQSAGANGISYNSTTHSISLNRDSMSFGSAVITDITDLENSLGFTRDGMLLNAENIDKLRNRVYNLESKTSDLSSYNNLNDLPVLNEVVLKGKVNLPELDIASATDLSNVDYKVGKLEETVGSVNAILEVL